MLHSLRAEFRAKALRQRWNLFWYGRRSTYASVTGEMLDTLNAQRDTLIDVDARQRGDYDAVEDVWMTRQDFALLVPQYLRALDSSGVSGSAEEQQRRKSTATTTDKSGIADAADGNTTTTKGDATKADGDGDDDAKKGGEPALVDVEMLVQYIWRDLVWEYHLAELAEGTQEEQERSKIIQSEVQQAVRGLVKALPLIQHMVRRVDRYATTLRSASEYGIPPQGTAMAEGGVPERGGPLSKSFRRRAGGGGGGGGGARRASVAAGTSHLHGGAPTSNGMMAAHSMAAASMRKTSAAPNTTTASASVTPIKFREVHW
jgi:hypothetical protein